MWDWVNMFLDPRTVGLHTGCRILSTVELHLSGSWISGSAWLFGQICRECYKTGLALSYRLSHQVQCSVMASGTSNPDLSKGLDAGTYWKW
jgi:hypothetical protein